MTAQKRARQTEAGNLLPPGLLVRFCAVSLSEEDKTMKADEEFVAYMERLLRQKETAKGASVERDAIAHAYHTGAVLVLEELLDIAKN